MTTARAPGAPTTDVPHAGGLRALTSLALIGVVVLPNLVGAAVVLVLAAWVLPTGPGVDRTYALALNITAFVAYLLVAVPVGAAWGWRRTRLRTGDDPEGAARAWRRLVLRGPLRITAVQAPLWAVAVVLFVGINLAFSVRLAVSVGFVVALGGIATCAVAGLFAARALRPEVARVLADSPPPAPALPGVLLRGLGAWTLGTGVPVVGIVLVGVSGLLFVDYSRTRLAVVVIVLGAITLAVGFLVTALTAVSTAAPVLAVRRALAEVEQGNFDARVPVFDTTELGLLQAGFNTMAAGLAERERMRDVFGRQVGADVARRTLAGGVELGGETREVAVLFVDLVGSTQMAAVRPAHEVVLRLNAFFGTVVEVVAAHDGWVNKFEGDAVLAVFGAPESITDPAGRALAAARALAARLEEDPESMLAGIGVSAGPAVAGNVGAARRFEYTVIGDPVNVASRLSELAKARGGVLAAGEALERAGTTESAHWAVRTTETLRGRSRPVEVAAPREH